MSIMSAYCKVQGAAPLLMHAFPLVPIEALDKKLPAEQAKYSEYRTPDGKLYIPGTNIQRALVSGATYSKGKGRGSLQKSAAACLVVDPEYCVLDAQTYLVDSRPVVIPSTKGRVMRHRPRFDKWGVEFTISWDDTLLKGSEVRRIVDDTGSRVGLLDFRPEKKGPFGRYTVVSWVSA